LLIASLVLLAILAALFVVIKMIGKNDSSDISSLGNRLLEYRIKRETATGELETLPLDNTIRAGDSFSFEVKLIHPGSFYVFSQQSEKNQGSWQWLNASSNASTQTTRVGEWLQSPFGYWLKADDKTSLKKYLLVFVPQGLNWSPANTLTSQQLSMTNTIAEIPPEIVSAIQESLQQEAVGLNAVSSQQGKVVSFSLSKKDDAKQISFYEVKMN
jgi:hypothetical protein